MRRSIARSLCDSWASCLTYRWVCSPRSSYAIRYSQRQDV